VYRGGLTSRHEEGFPITIYLLSLCTQVHRQWHRPSLSEEVSTMFAQSHQPAQTEHSTPLDQYARWGLWATLVWAVLLFVGNLSHQPNFKTDFPASVPSLLPFGEMPAA
jgi:hypothetical protein